MIGFLIHQKTFITEKYFQMKMGHDKHLIKKGSRYLIIGRYLCHFSAYQGLQGMQRSKDFPQAVIRLKYLACLTTQIIKEYDFPMKRTISVTQAARNFSDLVNRAYYRGESAVLVRSGQPVARLVPITPEPINGEELADLWESMPHLTPDEAEKFAQDIEASREALNQAPQSSWD